ncbi:MAG TPA: amino acid racemase [Blastocatellia bacterium]
MGNILGVLGGMGPLASAEFVSSIYQSGRADNEQQSPVVLLVSDPTFPDRTQWLLSGKPEELKRRLEKGLDQLAEMGAARMVVCCVTIHYLLPGLPARLRDKTVSLVDVVLSQITRRKAPHLLVCSNGTRKLRIFQQNARWKTAARYFVLPEEEDQQKLHELIYGIKLNTSPDEGIRFVSECMSKYQVDGFIAGCTEVHMMVKHGLNRGYIQQSTCLDPLLILAEEAWHPRFYERNEYQADV